MGSQIARDLVAAGHEMTLFDLDRDSLDAFAGSGARLAASVAAVAADSEIVGICVVDDKQVRDVVSGEGGLLESGLEPGSVVMVHSTVHPSTIEEMGEMASAAGVELIDVCVSAGPLGKTRLDRVAIVGAGTDTYQRCADVLNEIGTPVLVGRPGTASQVKLLNNLLTTATVGTAEAALRIGEQAGIDRRVLQRVFLSGSAASVPLSMMVRRTDRTSHRYRMLSKDFELALSSLEFEAIEVDDFARILAMAELGLEAVESDIDPSLRDEV
jgi:3-hydroxyisobutyrate dehydrogenase-like beta-hydroxyacid dehydrogenase